MNPEEMLEMETRLEHEGVCVEVSSNSARLDHLWRLFVEKENSVRMLTQELEELRAKRGVEIKRVQLYIQNIRSLSKTRDLMEQELEQENEVLRSNLTEIILQQEVQNSEIAEMVVQEGLAELATSSLSEQVAYLLADRAALMEKIQALEDADSKALNLKCPQKESTPDENAGKAAPLRGQSPWKRLLGFSKAAQTKQDDNQAKEDRSSKGRERRVLERDLEKASARLNLAHKEIRHLTDELELAQLTNRTYKPELHEAEQFRHEVEKLKCCDLAEAQAAERTSDVLDEEIRHLKDSVHSMGVQLLQLETEACNDERRRKEDAEYSTLELQDKDRNVQHLQKTELLEKLEEVNDANAQRNHRECWKHLQLLVALNTEPKHLKSLLTEEQQQDLADKMPNNTQSTRDVLKTMLLEQEYQKLRQEIEKMEEFCEKLQIELQQVHCTLHGHVRKYNEMKVRYREKLSGAKEVYVQEMTWRDQKIKKQEGELDILTKRLKNESDMVKTVTSENEALLLTKKTLLCQLNEAEENRKDTAAKVSALQLRVNFLEKDSMQQWEMNMKKSTHIAKLERRLWDVESLKSTRYLKKHHRNLIKGTKEESFSEMSTIRKTKDSLAEKLRLSASPCLSAGSETGYMRVFTHSLG